MAFRKESGGGAVIPPRTASSWEEVGGVCVVCVRCVCVAMHACVPHLSPCGASPARGDPILKS